MTTIDDRKRLRLLSYNIQAGVYTQRYRQYLTQSWKHVLPHRERLLNLNRIASMIHGYDLVGLQEVDSGSLRSGFVDQTEYLAHRAGFPHWYKQVNRSHGKFAQHSNGLLSRIRHTHIEEHKLPGLPGRGAIIANYGEYDHDADSLDNESFGIALQHTFSKRTSVYVAYNNQDADHKDDDLDAFALGMIHTF